MSCCSYGKIKREDIPSEIVDVLGCTNKDIINTIILDIINNSMNKPYIKMSDDVYKALFALKRFNYENIYMHSLSKEKKEYYERGMNKIYDRYLKDIENHKYNSIIYSVFLKTQSDKYINSTDDKRKVIDFIAGMTDDMFINEIEKYN